MKRSSGVLAHVSCLPGLYSSGAFGEEAENFIDFLAESGFTYWQVLPFCMTDAYDSPYKSPSAFSGNPYFIDLGQLHRQGLLTSVELESAKQQTPYLCEFSRLRRERIPLLFRAAERFGWCGAISSFLDTHPQIRHFCRYMAYKAQNPDAPWTAFGGCESDERTYRAWAFIEYTFFAQWQRIREYAARRGISIIGDIPIYVAYDSADVYANPELFDLDIEGYPRSVAGVPPDYFSEEGQLWGNPLYNWRRMGEDDYAWWRDRMGHMLSLFDGVRIDHFRGFDTYFAIPYGAKTAKNGVWRQGPGEPFIDSMRELLGDSLIIAEDLGEHMPSVEALLRYSGFPGMRVLQFAFPDTGDTRHLPHAYERNSVAYSGTHDNNTLLGYVLECEPSVRRELFRYCGYDGEDAVTGCRHILRTLLSSPADLVIFPIQDILLYGADTRMNTPGVAQGNWAFRFTREQLERVDRHYYAELNRLYRR